MLNGIFEICYVSVQNCFLYLPQNLYNASKEFGSKPAINVLCNASTMAAMLAKVFSMKPVESKSNVSAVYLSGQSWSSLSKNSVGLDPLFAKCLGVPEKMKVSLTEVTNVASVAKVYVTPVTGEDLEILETCAAEVESFFLSQLRVIWPNQIFPLWISKSLSVSFQVDFVEPSSKVGALEQFSEIIVNSNVPSGFNVQNYFSKRAYEDNEDNKSVEKTIKCTDATDSFGLNLQEDSSSDLSREELCFGLEENVMNLSKIKKSFIFRVHPLSALTASMKVIPVNPFYLFLFRKHLSKLISSKTKPIYCKVSKIPLILSNEFILKSKEERKDSSKDSEDSDLLLSKSSREYIFLTLRIIEESEYYEPEQSIPNHKCAFLSPESMRMLSLDIKSKIRIEICTINENIIALPTDFFVSCSNHSDKEELLSEFKEFLKCLVETEGCLMLNQTSSICLPLHGNKIQLTVVISSNKSEYFLLNKESLKHLNFRLVDGKSSKFESEAKSVENNGFLLNLDYIYRKHIENLLFEGKNLLRLGLQLDKPFKYDVLRSPNILVRGNEGSGKTTFVELLSQGFASAPYFVFIKQLSCKVLKGKAFDKIEKTLKQSLLECAYHEPAVLVLDDFDAIGSAVLSHDNFPELVHFSKICKSFKEILIKVQSVLSIILIATADSSTKLNEEIIPVHNAPLFNVSFEITELTSENRTEIFSNLFPERVLENGCKLDLEFLAMRTENYVLQDFSDLLSKVKFLSWKKTNVKKSEHFINLESIKKAIDSTVPLGLRGVDLKKEVQYAWKDIGGMQDVKRALTEYLIWPSKYPQVFAQNPLKIQSGILLYGIPGTGKTLIASSLVRECQFNFISVKGPELLSKFIGASEEGIRNIFRKAESAKPCILFFDEFDSLAPRRGQDSTGVTDRVVNQLLTQLDGVETLNGVTVIAATSRPDLIDPALLRPGRLHHLIHCPLPHQHERFEILKILSGELPMGSDVNLHHIAQLSGGFTGADLRGLLYTAQMNSVEESSTERPDVNQMLNVSEVENMVIRQKHLLSALESTTPSVSVKEKEKYRKIYRSFLPRQEGEDDVVNNESLPQKVILA